MPTPIASKDEATYLTIGAGPEHLVRLLDSYGEEYRLVTRPSGSVARALIVVERAIHDFGRAVQGAS